MQKRLSVCLFFFWEGLSAWSVTFETWGRSCKTKGRFDCCLCIFISHWQWMVEKHGHSVFSSAAIVCVCVSSLVYVVKTCDVKFAQFPWEQLLSRAQVPLALKTQQLKWRARLTMQAWMHSLFNNNRIFFLLLAPQPSGKCLLLHVL